MRGTVFARMSGDLSTYTLGNADAAVHLCKVAPIVAADIETGSVTSAGRWDVKAFSVSDGHHAHVLDPAVHGRAILECTRAARGLIFHNAAYDVPIMYAAGLLDLSSIEKVQDTLISARLAWPDPRTDSNSLGPLCDRVLGEGYRELKDALERGFKASNPSLSKSDMFDLMGLGSAAYVAYAGFDTLATARLYHALPEVLVDRLHPDIPGLWDADSEYLNEREQTVSRVLLRQSALGIRLDDQAADDVVVELLSEQHIYRDTLLAHGIDPFQSAAVVKRQIVERMAEAGRLPASWPRLADGSPSARKDWLERLEDAPEAAAAVAMARADRFIKDYRNGSAALTRDGRIHPVVSVLAAVTGRMSYSGPALQQYPGAVRRMFAFDAPVTSFDWASIEPVVLGNLAEARDFLEPFEAGGDLYEPIAAAAGCDRKSAKVVLLALMYGQGPGALALRLGITEAAARELQQSIRAAMPAVSRVIDRIKAYADSHGMVATVSGRVLPIPLDPRTGNRTFLGFKGTNYVVQGSAYDLLAEAIYAMARAGLGDSLRLAIHDELVVDTEAADEVQRIMETPPRELVRAANRVPVLRVGRTDLGLNWSAKS